MDSMADLEVIGSSDDKKNKTLLEDIVTTQHTRRTTLSHQNSAQESKNCNDFVTKPTDWLESASALGILTLNFYFLVQVPTGSSLKHSTNNAVFVLK